LQSVLEQLDGCELPLAAWEPAVLAARVADYDPEWLDRLCFSGRIGWARLSGPQNPNTRTSAPLRTSPIALYQRENLRHWLMLTQADSELELSGAAELCSIYLQMAERSSLPNWCVAADCCLLKLKKLCHNLLHLAW